MEAYDANYIGGDINGGIADWRQLLFRPVAALEPVLDLRPGDLPVLVVDAARAAASTAWAARTRPAAPPGGWVDDDRPEDAGTRLGARHPRADAARRRARSAGGVRDGRAVRGRRHTAHAVLRHSWPRARGSPSSPADRVAAAPHGDRPRARDLARHRDARGSPRRDRRSARGVHRVGERDGLGVRLGRPHGDRARVPQRIVSDRTVGAGRPAAHRDDHPRGDPARRRSRDERDGARLSVRRRRPQPICPAVPRRGAGGARAQHPALAGARRPVIHCRAVAGGEVPEVDGPGAAPVPVARVRPRPRRDRQPRVGARDQRAAA